MHGVRKMTTNETILILVGVLIGILIGFMFWHPTNNDYVSNDDYNLLYQDYQQLQQEHQEIKNNIDGLLVEYVGKEVLSDIFGLKKYKALFRLLGYI